MVLLLAFDTGRAFAANTVAVIVAINFPSRPEGPGLAHQKR
jgi:hypothetical protein